MAQHHMFATIDVNQSSLLYTRRQRTTSRKGVQQAGLDLVEVLRPRVATQLEHIFYHLDFRRGGVPTAERRPIVRDKPRPYHVTAAVHCASHQRDLQGWVNYVT